MSVAAARPDPLADGPFGPEDFAQRTGVSRETFAKLVRYQELLELWRQRISLVGRSTLTESWRRHFYDSAQLFPLLHGRVLYDLGSGAGFPGLVLAIMAAGAHRPLDTHLVESDGRKAGFLAEVARETGMARMVTIHRERIEKLPLDRLPKADTIVARALAPLDDLLSYAAPLRGPGTICLFMKGAKAAAELTAARKHWTIAADSIPSQSDSSGTLLRIAGWSRGRRSST